MLRPCAVLLLEAFLCAASAFGEERPRYAGMLTDGTRISGEKLNDWDKPGTPPKLDQRPLFEGGSPIVWLRDDSRSAGDVPEAFVETVGGDRLPGEVAEFVPAGLWQQRSAPAHFVVRTTENFNHPEDPRRGEVRVIERFVCRIVWQRQRGLADGYEPSTLLYRDGRTLRYRAVRFEREAVRVLAEDGSRRVPFDDIAELHLPARAVWDAYFDELAALDPACEARLLQLESTAGLRLTGSLARFMPRPDNQGQGPDHWLHGLQPAWSLGILWVPCRTVTMYRSFAPQQPPLSRIAVEQATLRGMLGGGWPWQLNRNTQGGPLKSGGQAYGWGFGVHAFAELSFPLPPQARSFRTRVGLDDLVGSGGCVRVRVYAGSTKSTPLYESPFLVGAEKTLDTGPLTLPSPRGPSTLILQVDAAHDGRPAGADPLDVRDVLDWLDPVVELDAAALKAEVQRRVPAQIFAWEGWEALRPGDAALRTVSYYDDSGPEHGVFLTTAAADAPLTLRRSVQIGPNQNWLVFAGGVRADHGNKIALQLRVAGEPLADYVVPNGVARDLQVFAFPLEHFQGQRATFDIVQQPGDPRLSVWWRMLSLSEQLPVARCVFDDAGQFTALDRESKATATLGSDDPYTGRRCVTMTSGGRFRLAFDPPLRVRGSPQVGEYRLLRFAVRKAGQGRFSVEFEHDDSQQHPCCYDAGKGPPCQPQAKRIFGDELPDGWMVFTRDVAGDFGDRDLTGLIFSAPDGQAVAFDMIYFVRWYDDMKWLPPERPGHLANRQTRKAMVDNILRQALPATVRIEVEGRQATGMLIGNEGYAITTGHLLGRPGKKATVTLGDGRRVEGQTAGIDRATDLGLVKLPQNVPVSQPSLREWVENQDRNLYVALGQGADDAPDAKPQTATPQIWRAFYGTIWADDAPPNVLPGGLLLNWDGGLIGVQTRHSRFGGRLYSKTQPAQQNWDRLKRGEIFGQWLRGCGPTLGVKLASGDDGCRVVELLDGAPAVDLRPRDLIERLNGQPVPWASEVDRLLAEKDPDDEVTLDLLRGQQKLQVKLRLQARRS